MDETKMKLISTMLFEHMAIGMKIFNSTSPLTTKDIQIIANEMGVTEYSVSIALKDLVSHGIISVAFDDDYQLNYTITEFGKYFFEQFFLINNDAEELFKKANGE
ncbi:helix-turn-helix domain-containing protein [Alkalibacter mobilis]|uniref:hypothetical protein n=1 Tax=Alkalibacter mobilis TaxID=2787712 RepID=UPI00189DE27B|nr:hypothetical protein [Alkalibacter mobilis]MBF7097804.1 hypothetical protein [Alkalibacter mobilis]